MTVVAGRLVHYPVGRGFRSRKYLMHCHQEDPG